MKRIQTSLLLSVCLMAGANVVLAADGTWIVRDGVGTGGSNWAKWSDTENWSGGIVASGTSGNAVLSAAKGRYVALPAELSLHQLKGDDTVIRGDGELKLNLNAFHCDLENCYLYSPYSVVTPESSTLNNGGFSSAKVCGPCFREDGVGNIRWSGSNWLRFDLYATNTGARAETGWYGDIRMDQWAGVYMTGPRGSSSDVVARWSQVAESPFLVRVNVHAEHALCVGTTVTGDGIPVGTFLKRVFPDGSIELSKPASKTVVDNEIKFSACTAKMEVDVAGRVWSGYSTAAPHYLNVQKYRVEDDFTVRIDGFYVSQGGDANALWTIRCESGMVPGKLVIGGFASNCGVKNGLLTLENCDVELDGDMSACQFTVPNIAHVARMGVPQGAARSVRFVDLAGTVVKTSKGRLTLAGLESSRLTGTVVAEEGELAIDGIAYVPKLELKSGATFIVPATGVRIGSLSVEKGAILRGNGKVTVDLFASGSAGDLVLEGAWIVDSEISSDPLSITVLSGSRCVAREGEDTIFVFDANSTVRFNGSGVADVLVVGGGGGGGAKWGGGGGGGGVVYRKNVSISNGYYGIAVGKGGVGAVAKTSLSEDGGESSAFGIVAKGGGGGGTYSGGGEYWPDYSDVKITVGRPGASGGGGGVLYPAAVESIAGGKGTEGQGCDGGASRRGKYSYDSCGGGGGGAAGVGTAATYSDDKMIEACGGAGVLCTIYGEKYYGGGGGGGGTSTKMTETAGLGGVGGGGNGGRAAADASSGVPGDDGADGFGGGGGGGSGMHIDKYDANSHGGRGGSGVVIVRFRKAVPEERELPDNPIAEGGSYSKRHSYGIHTFRTDGQFKLTKDSFVDILVVGGGGGGGANAGGGGGAGGVIIATNIWLQAGVYPVAVGLGGAGAPDEFDGVATEGGESSFGGDVAPRLVGFTALGGGRGGTHAERVRPTEGASGGGAGGIYYGQWQTVQTCPGANGVENQGCAGGASMVDVSVEAADRKKKIGGGGGGGAGEPGASSPVFGTGGNGGVGKVCDFSGSQEFYGGGGAAGSSYGGWCTATDPYVAVGGMGGGGRGGAAYSNGTATPGEDGVDGTGGGGGGGGAIADSKACGGKGGSGIVIVRYRLARKGLILTVR